MEKLCTEFMNIGDGSSQRVCNEFISVLKSNSNFGGYQASQKGCFSKNGKDGFKPSKILTEDVVGFEIYLSDPVETLKQQTISNNDNDIFLQPFESDVRIHPMNDDIGNAAGLVINTIKESMDEKYY